MVLIATIPTIFKGGIRVRSGVFRRLVRASLSLFSPSLSLCLRVWAHCSCSGCAECNVLLRSCSSYNVLPFACNCAKLLNLPSASPEGSLLGLPCARCVLMITWVGPFCGLIPERARKNQCHCAVCCLFSVNIPCFRFRCPNRLFPQLSPSYSLLFSLFSALLWFSPVAVMAAAAICCENFCGKNRKVFHLNFAALLQYRVPPQSAHLQGIRD